VLTKYVYLVCF